MDKSYLLESLVLTEYNGDYYDYLGEMEYAFISFLLGQNYDSFEQWKNMLVLLCRCDKASREKIDFFTDFLKVIYYQIQEVPNDFFEDIVTNDNFLILSIRELSEIVTEDYPEAIRTAIKKLQDLMEMPHPDTFYLCSQEFPLQILQVTVN